VAGKAEVVERLANMLIGAAAKQHLP